MSQIPKSQIRNLLTMDVHIHPTTTITSLQIGSSHLNHPMQITVLLWQITALLWPITQHLWQITALLWQITMLLRLIYKFLPQITLLI